MYSKAERFQKWNMLASNMIGIIENKKNLMENDETLSMFCKMLAKRRPARKVSKKISLLNKKTETI